MADVKAYVEKMIGEGKYKRDDEGVVIADGFPVDMKAVGERLAAEEFDGLVAARDLRDDGHVKGGEVVLLAFKVADAHDSAKIVLQVVDGEGADVTIILSKPGMVKAEAVAKRLVLAGRVRPVSPGVSAP